MTGEELIEFNKTHPIVEQTRVEWVHQEEWDEYGKQFPVTAVICQRNTPDLIRITVESLLRFYPDMPVLVVDGGSNDESILYLKYKELTHPNFKVWVRNLRNGHGDMAHEGVVNYVKTEYFMLVDSDVAFMRGNFIEPMIHRFQQNKKLYAIGTLQYSSYKNNGGEPDDAEDAIPYANPQLSIYHTETYHELNAPFIEDGTPCILNMKAAYDAKLDIEYFPTDKYMLHLSGGSWMNPPNIWPCDNDVKIRPFVTFIVSENKSISKQDDSDFDMVVEAKQKGHLPLDHPPPMYYREPELVGWELFGLRFNVYGEYVCDICAYNETIPETFVTDLKKKVIEEKAPDEITVHNLKCYKRTTWQRSVK